MNQTQNTEKNTFQRFQFWELTPVEQDAFEDICEYMAERASILEYDAGYTRADAEQEAERLTLERFPPSAAARATILTRANAMAAHYGFPEWDAWKHLDAARMGRMHIKADYWLALRDYFEQRRKAR